MIILGRLPPPDGCCKPGRSQALEEKLSRYFKRDPRLQSKTLKNRDGFELASREIAHRPPLQEVLSH